MMESLDLLNDPTIIGLLSFSFEYVASKGLDAFRAKFKREGRELLAFQLITCLKNAHQAVCQQYDWEYNSNAIEQILLNSEGILENISDDQKLKIILTQAVGGDENEIITKPVVDFWLEALDEQIACQQQLFNYIHAKKTATNTVQDIEGTEHNYLYKTDKTNRWHYNIVLLDDVQEQLDMLEEEIQTLIDSDGRYKVRIFSATKSSDVIIKSQDVDIDVFVLDVARKAPLKSQTRKYDYFGYDLYKLLITEKPNVSVTSRFFILSRLPMKTVMEEFDGADVVYFKKQKTSNSEVAQQIKGYLDQCH